MLYSSTIWLYMLICSYSFINFNFWQLIRCKILLRSFILLSPSLSLSHSQCVCRFSAISLLTLSIGLSTALQICPVIIVAQSERDDTLIDLRLWSKCKFMFLANNTGQIDQC